MSQTGRSTTGKPSSYVSTGDLPPEAQVRTLVNEAYERFKGDTQGETSNVYPALPGCQATYSASALPALTDGSTQPAIVDTSSQS